MKIAIYWESELWGGSDSHLLTLLKNWSDENDQFVLFSNQNNQGYKRISRDLDNLPNVKCVEFLPVFDRISQKEKRLVFTSGLLKFWSYTGKPLLFRRMVAKCKKLLKKHGPFDGLLAFNGGYPASWGVLASVIAAKKIGVSKRILHILHSASKPGIYTFGFFEHMIDRAICRSATDIVALSQATRKTLLDFRMFNVMLNPIRVIYSGIDFEPEKAENDAVDLRREFGLGDTILVGVVGRIERYKGHEDLITGYSFLPGHAREKIKLIFIGTGEKTEIERLKRISDILGVKEAIVFTGFLEGSPQRIIEQLDVLAVMTKDFEGFGLTLAEAMSVKTPVISTNVGAVPEFVTEETGFLVSPESPFEVFSVLTKLVEEPAHFQQKAENAKQHIRAFSPERLYRQFHLLFHLD